MKPLTIRQNLASLPPTAWVLFAGTFINRFGTFVTPFLVLYMTRLGYSIGQAGLAAGAYGGGHLAASFLGGHLADRIGRRHTISLSMFASSAAMLALSQARSLPLVMMLTFCAGLAAELYRPASHALVTDLVPPEQRVFAFGMYRFAVNLGFAAGPAMAGFLAEHSFFYLFLCDALTSVGFGVIALLALPHGMRITKREEQESAPLRAALRDKAFVLFLLATVCITPVDFQMGSSFALHIKALGYPASTYGMLISLNGVLIIVFELLITQVTQRYQARRVIALGYFLAGFGFALTALAHTLPLLAMTVAVWTIGEMISSPVAGAYVSHLAPVHLRGRYMGLLTLMWSIGMVVGPSLGTYVFARNETALWIGCGVLAILSATFALMSRPPGTA